MQYSTSWLRADPSLIHQFCRKRPYSNKPVISARVHWPSPPTVTTTPAPPPGHPSHSHPPRLTNRRTWLPTRTPEP